jgi:hypothetical protein
MAVGRGCPHLAGGYSEAQFGTAEYPSFTFGGLCCSNDLGRVLICMQRGCRAGYSSTTLMRVMEGAFRASR